MAFMIMSKTFYGVFCKYCGKEIEQKRKDQTSAYLKQMFCNRKCAIAYRKFISKKE